MSAQPAPPQAPTASAVARRKAEDIRKFANAASAVCHTLLGANVTRVEAPGGRRKSMRVFCDDQPVIVTRRRQAQRARLEVTALHAMHARGAPVPKVLAFDGLWLIQEDLGGQRLPQLLDGATQKKGEAWLDAALGGLAACHAAARDAHLERTGVVIGREAKWLAQLIGIPTPLGKALDLAPPPLPEREIAEFLRVRQPSFLKWDARPGNAIGRDDGTVSWFDWEHSGCRNPTDDLAWLLGDEFIPDWPRVEQRLLKRHLPAFATEELNGDEAAAYLATFGTFHMCMRLTIILTFKRGGPWWDWDDALARDTVGIAHAAAQATCKRAARWAQRAPLTEALAPWLESLIERMPEPNKPDDA